ncbi:hypothetical protein IV203_007473 [Nitzschia inconspicua]|uniref:Uncharacterized protein n=1 Tax=Nitzschia inconspicua TaxID=303405 RepID=A0A9K3KEZ3_9STRA|nr:hypothetical protein IV203_007473 [Nitzschia inconspicua]
MSCQQIAHIHCNITCAKQLLVLAKRDLGIPQDESPGSKKKEVFDKALQIGGVESQYKSSSLDKVKDAVISATGMVVYIKDPWADELSADLPCQITNAKHLLVLAKRDLGLPDDENNCNGAALVPAEVPTEAPISAGGDLEQPADCEQQEKDFSVSGLDMAMAVSSDITAVEIAYAARVFERTYVSIVTGTV